MTQATQPSQSSISDSDYITADELVERFKNMISKRTLANWRHNGEGPKYVKIGGRILYRLSAVTAWEEKRTRG